jgi:putative salt-induced outer membrane protein
MVRLFASRRRAQWTGRLIGALLPWLVELQPLNAQSTPPAAASQPKPVPKPPPKRYEFNGTLGFSQTRGNAEALAANVSNKFRYGIAGWSMQQDLAFFYGKANGKINTNFWNGGLRGDRVLHQRMSVFLAARYDRNQLQGITNRFQQGFGLNLLAIDDKQNRLNVSLGGSLFQQELTAGSTVRLPRAFPAARAAFDYRRRFTGLAYIQQNAEYLPAVGDTATSYFVNTETAVVAPLSKSVGLKVGYVIRYNSDPPVRNRVQLRTTDTFFSSGLTLTF